MLKGVVEKEIQKIREAAATAAVKLGFGPGKARLEAVYLELEWWDGRRLNPAQAARVRCLEALGTILDPLSIKDTDWIREIDQSVGVLRRDGIKAAPRGPGGSILRAFKRKERERSEATETASRRIDALIATAQRINVLKAAGAVAA